MAVSSSNLSSQEQALCRAIESRADAMLSDLERHVGIPTGKGHAPGLDEYRGILTDRASALGASVRIEEGDHRPDWLIGGAASTPPTAVCEHHKSGATKTLIACHIDTVFDPTSSFNSFTIAPDGETATGPGVVDMKGGILVAINALEALAEIGIDSHWTLALTSDEEVGSYCSDRILRELAREHEVGIATEPALPGGELAIERMGSGQFRVDTYGRAAHVGRDFVHGVSAVNALAETIVTLSKTPDPERGKLLSIGPLQGGHAVNAVPDHACAWGNMRYPDKAIEEEFAEELDALNTSDDAMPRVEVRCSFNRPAKPLTPGTERFAMLAREIAEALGQSLPFAKTGGVCDGNVLQAEGIPTIDSMGVRGGGLHTTDEWIEIASLVERAQLMAVLLARLAEKRFDGSN